jgi:hypothetical protein
MEDQENYRLARPRRLIDHRAIIDELVSDMLVWCQAFRLIGDGAKAWTRGKNPAIMNRDPARCILRDQFGVVFENPIAIATVLLGRQWESRGCAHDGELRGTNAL